MSSDNWANRQLSIRWRQGKNFGANKTNHIFSHISLANNWQSQESGAFAFFLNCWLVTNWLWLHLRNVQKRKIIGHKWIMIGMRAFLCHFSPWFLLFFRVVNEQFFVVCVESHDVKQNKKPKLVADRDRSDTSLNELVVAIIETATLYQISTAMPFRWHIAFYCGLNLQTTHFTLVSHQRHWFIRSYR